MYTIVFIWLSVMSLAKTDPVITVRNSIKEIKSNSEADKFIKNLDNDPSIEAKAYIAILNFIKSRIFKSPIKKIKYFNRARKILENVINLHSQHVELRYLRYSIQSSVPDFLGYNANIDADLEFIIKEIIPSSLSKEVKVWVLQSIIELDKVNDEDRKKIENILNIIS